MKLAEFSENGITLKCYFQKSANENCNTLIVVPANSMEKENSLNFVFNLARLKNAHMLFIAASGCQHGFYLVKDGADAPQRTLEALIEKYRSDNKVDAGNVYMIGFCASSYTCVQVSVSRGYNPIITSFGYEGDRLLQPTVTREKEEYLIRLNAKRIEDGKFTAEEWVKMVTEYIGMDDYWKDKMQLLEVITESGDTAAFSSFIIHGKTLECYLLFVDTKYRGQRIHPFIVENSVHGCEYYKTRVQDRNEKSMRNFNTMGVKENGNYRILFGR